MVFLSLNPTEMGIPKDIMRIVHNSIITVAKH